MRYFSTNKRSPDASFRDAVLKGQPADGGLYFPSHIPTVEPDLLETLAETTKEEVAFRVIRPFVGGEIPDDILFEICADTVNFDFPVVEVTPGMYALELFHGPTLAFKDVGARFMSRCLAHFSESR